MSVETIAALADETAAALDTMNTELGAAQSFHDPDLQQHAIQAKRAALATEARARAAQAITGISTRAESAAGAAAAKLEASRPHIADDPAALIRAEQTWNYDVRPLLEAGTPIKAILREASIEEVLAIERFGAGYLRAAKSAVGPGNPLELEPEEFGAAVNSRIASALPEERRAGFEQGVLAADAAATLRQIQGMATETIAGNTLYTSSAIAHARTLAIRLRG